MTSRRRIILTVTVIGVALLAAFMLVSQTPRLAFWRTQEVAHKLVLSGNIEAHESVLSFKSVQSRIIDLPFNEGQWVKKGTVLAVLDSSDYRQQIVIAEGNLAVQRRQLDTARQNLVTTGRTLLVDQADLKQRQLDYQRALDLQQQGFTSKATLDQSDTALKQSNAVLARDQSVQTAAARTVDVAQASASSAAESVALARIVVGYTTLIAPFDGVVSVRQAEVGEVVVPGTPVLTLSDLEHVWLRAYLNESDLGRVHIGQQVSVSNDSHPGKHYQGRVSFISDKAEFTPKSVETHAERVNLVYRIKIDITNPEHELVPGMPADATVELQTAGP